MPLVEKKLTGKVRFEGKGNDTENTTEVLNQNAKNNKKCRKFQKYQQVKTNQNIKNKKKSNNQNTKIHRSSLVQIFLLLPGHHFTASSCTCPAERQQSDHGSDAAQKKTWFCLRGFFIFGLTKVPFGDYFFIFSRLLKQIQEWVRVKNIGSLKKPGLVKGKIDPATCGPQGLASF